MSANGLFIVAISLKNASARKGNNSTKKQRRFSVFIFTEIWKNKLQKSTYRSILFHLKKILAWIETETSMLLEPTSPRSCAVLVRVL